MNRWDANLLTEDNRNKLYLEKIKSIEITRKEILNLIKINIEKGKYACIISTIGMNKFEIQSIKNDLKQLGYHIYIPWFKNYIEIGWYHISYDV